MGVQNNSCCPQPTMSHDLQSRFDEHKWIDQIRQILQEEPEEEDILVSIFNVPKPLMAIDPNCYIPQEIAIGPYHHWRPGLYEMQGYKLAAAKRLQKQLKGYNLENVVLQLMRLEYRIRACYHKYLDFSGKTLAWMIAVDASFLLEFLQVYAIQEKELPCRVSSRMSHLVDFAGTKPAHNAILRDIVMLENQIPLFVLRKMLEVKFSSESGDDLLVSMLMGLHNELSPFNVSEDLPSLQVSRCSHLLDFLYEMIVPKLEETTDQVLEIADDNDLENENSSSSVKRLQSKISDLVSKWTDRLVPMLKKVMLSRPSKAVVKLPWTILSNLPGVAVIKQPVESMFFSQETKQENENSSNSPLLEEIEIPSVKDLLESGVCFQPTNGNMTTISFDVKSAVLYLPTVSFDINTEVLLRNLVAYEASAASGPLLLTRYTELMNGIIDTDEDVKLLRERRIVVSHLKDQEVANLWNGMSKSIRLTKVSFLDKVIEDINRYHHGSMQVKIWKFMEVYVFHSQIFTFVVAMLLLLMMTFHVFCLIYTCRRTSRFTSKNM